MKGRRRFLLVGGAIATLGVVIAFVLLRPRDPMFHGRPESVWISEIKYSMSLSDAENKEQIERWKKFGPEGLAVLSRGLANANPPIARYYRKKHRQLAPKLPGLIVRVLPAPRPDTGQATRMHMLSLLSRMGPEAVGAKEAVANALWDEHPHVKQIAINFFTSTERGKGPLNTLPEQEKQKLLPAFIRAAEDRSSNWGLRNNAMIALKFYTNDAQRLRPVLVRGMNDPSPHVQLRAADALHAIDPKAAKEARAVTVVSNVLYHPDDQIAYQAADVLRTFHDQPEEAIGALLGALEMTNTLVASSAVWALEWGFQKQAETILPAMHKAAQRKDNVGGYARSAVKRLEQASKKQP